MYPAFESTISSGPFFGPHAYFFAQSDDAGMPFASISRSPVSKMNEKSASGRPVTGAIAAPRPVAAPRPPPGGAAAIDPKLARPGDPPRRPPERLSQPSTRFLKKSVRSKRFDVRP